MTEKAIEQEIKDKGLTAPRLTPDHIDGMLRRAGVSGGRNGR